MVFVKLCEYSPLKASKNAVHEHEDQKTQTERSLTLRQCSLQTEELFIDELSKGEEQGGWK